MLRVADLEVDRFTQQVRRGGQAIELTPKEYALLEYLATNPGRVFSRTMIIEHVWDQSFEGLTNIVDVYVRHLRSKVDDPFPAKLIRTVRGVGYGLSESSETHEHALAQLPPGRLVRRRADGRVRAARRADLYSSCATTWRRTCCDTQARRAQQIADTLVAHASRGDEAALRAQVENLYSPEANDRFIRITRADGTVVYALGRPARRALRRRSRCRPAAGAAAASRAR